jgi:hypothetical protein
MEGNEKSLVLEEPQQEQGLKKRKLLNQNLTFTNITWFDLTRPELT